MTAGEDRITATRDSVQAQTWTLSETRTFVYDAWNCIFERRVDAAQTVTDALYTWGLDLSGSMQGAGGVGGLLQASRNVGGGVPTAIFYVYDGNGNVTALVDAADGSVVARYDYSPFGMTVLADGPAAAANPWRFSSKEHDATGLVYYGYRYYSPELGRWINRDPIGERGGLALHAICGNMPVSCLDPFGLAYTSPSLAAQRALYTIYSNFAGSQTGAVTGVTTLVGRLGYALSLVSNFVYFPSPTAVALYNPPADTMVLSPTLNPNDLGGALTVAHESTHAYNDLVGGVSVLNPSRDEGMAYVVDRILDVLNTWRQMEDILATFDPDWGSCAMLEAELRPKWQLGWNRLEFTQPRGYPGEITVAYSVGPLLVERSADVQDFNNVRNYLGLGVNCRALAEAYNSLMPACCQDTKFVCSPSPGTMDIAPTSYIPIELY